MRDGLDITHTGEWRGAHRFWWRYLRSGKLEELGINVRTILKLIFKKWDKESYIWHRTGTDGMLL